MTDINEYMKNNQHPDGWYLVTRAVCKDGFSVSIQARSGSYCSPREDNAFPYNEVELGFPSGPVPELAEWKDGEGPDEATVYGYVPVDVVEKLIDSHGGFLK